MSIEQMFIAAIIYLAGIFLAKWMLIVEHKAEKQEYTNGYQVICLVLSLLSFAIVIYMLVVAWVSSISTKGYWQQPVNKTDK